MFTEENADELLSGKPDFVLDAIDNIDTKVNHITKLAYIFMFPYPVHF